MVWLVLLHLLLFPAIIIIAAVAHEAQNANKNAAQKFYYHRLIVAPAV